MRYRIPLLIALVLFPTIVQAREIVAIKENFSDGNISTNPTWQAGDMHWFNPFFVEKIKKKYWAGSLRYGSMGAAFTHPADRHWPISLDAKRGRITVSMLVRFRTSTTRDHLSVMLIGQDSRISFNYYPKGRVLVTFKPANPENTRASVFQIDKKAPPAQRGKPVRIVAVYGGRKRLTIQIDGKNVLQINPLRYKRADVMLTQFQRIAFMGANHVLEPNVQLLIPQMQDTRAFRWITDIEVRGEPEIITIAKQPPLNAPARSALVFAGPSSILAQPAKTLRDAGWQVQDVFSHQPLRGEALRDFRDQLQIASLRQYAWVVLCDIDARLLGSTGCSSLREYVRCGGKLLILTGATGIQRGRYLDRELSDSLPVVSSTNSAIPRRLSLDKTLLASLTFDVKPKPDAHRLLGNVLGWEKTFGLGRVCFIPWAIASQPPQPFWRTPTWLTAWMTN